MTDKEYNHYLALLGICPDIQVPKELTPLLKQNNALRQSIYNLCNADANTFRDVCEALDKPRVLDVDDICAKLVEIVMQEYSELYSDDVPKIFLHKIFERFKYYLNEA